MSRGTIVEVNRSLLRPILFCKAEKKSTIMYGTLSLIVVVASNFSAPGIYVGPILFLVAHAFFIFLAKKDPQMIAVYMRHIKYKQGYFPARGGASANPEKIFIRKTVEPKRG